MTWQLLLLGYLVLGTVSYLLRRQLAKTFAKANRLVNAFFFVAVLYPIGLLVAAFTTPDLAIGWTSVLLLVIFGAIFPASNLLVYRANRDLDAGLFTIISDLIPVVSITVGWLALHETLSGQQLIGAAIILMATLLVTLPQLKHHMVHNKSALICAIVAVVAIGVGFVFERYLMTRMDFGAYLIFGWGAQMVWGVLLALPERKSYKMLLDPKIRGKLLGFSITSALRGLCIGGALFLSGNVSVVMASASFLTVLVVIAAYCILKEKEWLWLKLGAASLGVAGLLLINL
ncbi:MAG TPA: EamA family transporter [Candidatus Saccharimonadales bacterium]|nr:EamA family transporter [Candidatus Saccharimonadales bacterium]